MKQWNSSSLRIKERPSLAHLERKIFLKMLTYSVYAPLFRNLFRSICTQSLPFTKIFKSRRVWVVLMMGLASTGTFAQGQWLADVIAQREHGQSKPVAIQQQPQRNSFFQTHALVLFYASTCPHCHRFAPVLKNWADDAGARVLPLSFDNQPLTEFPDFKPVTTEWVNVAFAGRPISYPALFIANTQTYALYPVSIGAMSEFELANRMQDFIPKIIAHERSAV